MRKIRFRYIYQQIKNKKDISIYEFSLEEIEDNLDRFFEDIGLSFFSFKKFNKFQTENGYKLIARCQYTGFMDKNKKKIYEGDIVKVNLSDNPQLFEIAFYNGAFALRNKEGHFNYLCNMCMDYRAIEIIGNIYENKNLLNKQGDKNE